MKTAELLAKAGSRNVEQVTMTPQATRLFTPLRGRLLASFPDAIEIAEARSISYHAPEFFVEIIPRKRGLGLLIALDFNDVEGDAGFARDTSDYSFVVNARHQGGVLIDVRDEMEIDSAMTIVNQAHALVAGI